MVTQIVSLTDGATVHIHTLGRLVRVTAIATSIPEANDYLSLHHGQSVIAQCGDVVFIAAYADKGQAIKLK